MKKLLFLFGFVVLTVACFDWTNSQTGPTNPQPTPTPAPVVVVVPTPGPATACPIVARVAVSVPLTLLSGASIGIDATPKDAQGVKRPEACDLASGILWVQSGPCSLNNPNVFNPILTGGPGSGDCNLSAQVDGVRSDIMTVSIR